jgi:SAM-dependent methyltransferase
MSNAIDELQQIVDDYLTPERTFAILEAGCGSMSKLKLGSNIHVVGIDISEKQLERNTKLDERLLGDIHTYPLAESSFDIIICWDVLEHLQDPRSALENFLRACKPNGLIILAFPNLFSLKGIITKLTPYRVHIWYYKYFLGFKDPGRDDQPPFPTTLRLSMSYPAIWKLARSRNATVQFFAFRESPDMQTVRRKSWIMNALFSTASVLSRTLTFGKVDAKNSDCIMVLRPSGG